MLGGMADLPLKLGGGPSPSELAYRVIRKAVGIGGSATDDTGIEGLWRRSEAKGLAAASSHVPRALRQSNPLFATDTLPYYERILGVIPPEGSSEAQRREVVVDLWTRKLDLSVPGVAAQLAAIDPRLTVIPAPVATAITTQPGRAFGNAVSRLVLPFDISVVANYSSEFTLRVLFDLGYSGVPIRADREILARVRRTLRELLRGWENVSISTGPWVIGTTPIGLGSVG